MNNLKTAIQYGFIFGVALAILFLPYKDVQHTSNGRFIDYLHPLEYIVNVLRIGIVGGIISAIYYRISFKKRSKRKE